MIVLCHILRLFVVMLFSALGASMVFAVPMNASEISFHQGDAWDDLTPDQRWAANTNFLDKVAGNGDKINLSLPKGKIRPDSYLAKEIDYLTQNKGYTWVNQWILKPPSGD